MQRFKEHVEALEAERRKIQVFQREFPLSLELVTQAIEKCKQTQRIHGPVLEEFIPSKRTSDCRDDDEGKDHKLKKNNRNKENNEKPLRKSDWLKSAQLWNQTPDRLVQEDSPRKVSLIEVKRNGSGAFHPSERENSVVATPTTANNSHSSLLPASSTAESGGCNGGGTSKKEEKGMQCKRKERRSWSPELHRQFLQALQQLGGPHVATPKQIRELMKVDGLTNNEVKSHLQKYRFHTRTPTPIIHSNSNPQFVVVRAIWVPEYAVEATPPPPPVSLAAPPPTPLPPAAASDTRTQQHNREDVAHSNSPVSSSPTDTTTASPAA